MEASDKRIAKREEDVRARLSEPANQEAFVRLGAILANYREDPQPDAIQGVLDVITSLDLMTLPEHRFGLSGALIGISGLHPERKDRWKAHAPKLFSAAEKIVPSSEAEAQLNGDHIEFLWMLWMTTGDNAALRRVFKEAHKGGSAGDRATVLITLHTHLPEVARELMHSIATGRAVGYAPVPLPPKQLVLRKDVPQEAVDALNRHVAAMPGGVQRVILVGWTPAQGGTFLIITPDGQTWSECPKEWAGRPVTVIKADAQQLQIHQQVQSQMEEP